MDRRIAFQTLGCRLNSHETDALVARFVQAGYTVVPFDEVADVYVVNTCTVTAKSDRKSRNFINRARREAQALVVVTGCYVDNASAQLESEGLTYFVGNDQKSHLFELVDSYFKGELLDPDGLAVDRFGFNAELDSLRTRAVVKIQDGCDNYCSYCIIPHVRGRAVSRKLTKILDQTRFLIGQGYKEIVLTGINISRYASDGFDFTDVLKAVVALEGDFRIHIPSMEPENVTDDFLELLSNPKLCRHIHLCLQSGSDRILKAMNRRYTVAEYRALFNRIRERSELFNVTTDLIVGFPGETDGDFDSTLSLAREVGFGHIHTFKYSRREGTPAAQLKGQLAETVKTSRSKQLRELATELKISYRKKLLGKSQRVLVERICDGVASGYNEYYVPVKIYRAESLQENTFVEAVPTRLECVDGDFVLIQE